MKITEFKKLEKKITGYDFNQSYKNINVIMTILSYFGHITSIFLAFFFMSKIIAGAIDNTVVIFISSIIILAGLELLKRDVFDKFSIQSLKDSGVTKAVIPLLLTSIFLVSSSFYATVTGAKEFSSKSQKIEKNKKEIITKYSDSLTVSYDGKIKPIEEEIKSVKELIKSKDDEQTALAEVATLNRVQRQRINDLKEEKKSLKSDLEKLESNINAIKTERDGKIAKFEQETNKEKDTELKDNSRNSFLFAILSTIIELVILGGIFFNEYYKFRSYREFRDKIEKDTNYQKWLLYDRILDVLYNEDTKINQKLPSNKSILDMCKVNGILILNKDIIEFSKLIASIGIIKSSGSAKYISKPYDIAKGDLMKKFNIK